MIWLQVPMWMLNGLPVDGRRRIWRIWSQFNFTNQLKLHNFSWTSEFILVENDCGMCPPAQVIQAHKMTVWTEGIITATNNSFKVHIWQCERCITLRSTFKSNKCMCCIILSFFTVFILRGFVQTAFLQLCCNSASLQRAIIVILQN